MAWNRAEKKGITMDRKGKCLGAALAVLVTLAVGAPIPGLVWAEDAPSSDNAIVAQDAGAQDVNADIWDGSIDTSWYNTTATEFTLTKPAQLAGLAAIVNGDATGIVQDTFKGKTVKLGADIKLNATPASSYSDAATQRSWTPIGRMPLGGVVEGTEGAMPHYVDNLHFDGTFDGQGYVVRNIFIYDNTEGSYGGVQALFTNIGGSATIMNLGLDGGYVYGRVAAGLVATSHVNEMDMAAGTIPHIIGCYNTATIVCNGSSTRGAGGIFGGEEQFRGASDEGEANYHGAAYIANCYNAGMITRLETANCSLGGIAGTGSVQIYGCYNVGRIDTSSTYAGALAGNLIAAGYGVGQGSSSFEGASCVHDSYALQGCVPADEDNLVKLYNLIDANHIKGGKGEYSPAVTEADDAKFQSQAWFLSANAEDALSQSYDMPESGYPVLYWQESRAQWDFNAKDAYGYNTYEVWGIGRQTYTGSALTPAVKASYESGEYPNYTTVMLHEGSDFTVSYSSNTNPGTAHVTVTGIGRFYGTQSTTFEIINGDLTSATIETIEAQWWYGSAVEPNVVVKASNGDVLVKDRDYELSFTNNNFDAHTAGGTTKTATANVTPKSESSFTGSISKDFTIIAASDSLQGTGAESDPYQIGSKYDLQFLAWKTHTGNEIASYGAACYELTADIDARTSDPTFMTDRAVDPLFTSHGSSDDDFSHGLAGTFDGNGHTVTLGLTEAGVSFDITPALAFMIYTKSGASPIVKNLTIDGSITCPHGAAAGFLIMGQPGTITFENCTNEATIQGDSFYNGGASGFVTQTASQSKLNMTACKNEGTVTSASSRAAGFVGALGGQDGDGQVNTFTNCANSGNITAGQENGAGGMVATMLGKELTANAKAQTKFDRCSNSGAIYVRTNGDAGGLVGQCSYAVSSISFDRCYNTGSVSTTGISNTEGGLMGRSYSDVNFSNCFNTGTVTARSSNTNQPGGIIGYFTGALTNDRIGLLVTNCYSAGKLNLQGGDSVGGIIGVLWNHSTVTFSNAWYESSTAGDAIGMRVDEKWESIVSPPVVTGQATAIDADSMKTPTFVTTLGIAFSSDEMGESDTWTNGGFPILKDRPPATTLDSSTCMISDISPWTYTGAPVRPAVTVTTGGTTLNEGTDYIVFYSTNGTAGRAIVQGIGNYTGELEKGFAITACNINDCQISAVQPVNYSDCAGGQAAQDVTVTNPAGYVMAEGVDYEVTYSRNDAVGTAYMRVEGKAPYYTNSTTRMFSITQGDIATAQLSGLQEHYPLTNGSGGLYIYEELYANNGNRLLRSDSPSDKNDYIRLFYDASGNLVTSQNGAAAYNITKAGAYTVKFQGQGIDAGNTNWNNGFWTGTKEFSFTYGNRIDTDAEISGINAIYGYTGSKIEIEPSLVNKISDYPMTKGSDYTVKVTDKGGNDVTDNVVSTGEYTLTVSGVGTDWFGEKAIQFSVEPPEYFIDDSTVVEGIQSMYLSTGEAITPQPSAVKIGGKTLSSSDYTLSYQDANGNEVASPTAAGTYFVVIAGKGLYSGSKRVAFTIENPLISVYVREGETGEAKLAKAFSRDEFVALKSDGAPVSALYCSQSGTSWNVATAKEYVTLDDLIGAAGISKWGMGCSVSYGGDASQGKSSTTFGYDELQDLMFYPATTSSATDSFGGVKAPFVLSISDASCSIGTAGTTSAHDAEELNLKNAGSGNMPRTIMGLSSENYSNARTNATSKVMGVRLWSKTNELLVTIPAEEKEKPTPADDPTPGENTKPSDEQKGGDTPTENDNPGANAEERAVYRLYNENSGEHFYTMNSDERDDLASAGWSYEGIAWTAPSSSGTPVYRLYNANGGEHHYTTNADERNSLVSVGWSYEGISWYSDENKGVALYRLYNPNAFANNHHYTADTNERDWLLSLGWNDEGIAWYGL